MRLLFASILALLLLTGTGRAASPPEPWIEFVPQGPLDWLNMWTDDAPWHQAQKKVQAIVLLHEWIRTAPLSQVVQVLDFAKRHHMIVELSVEAVEKVWDGTTFTCGAGSEGYVYPGEIAQAVTILKNLGIQLTRVVMDEPMWFGSYATGPFPCQLAIPDLVTRVALIMSEVVSVYPRVTITEVEPLPAFAQIPTWRQDMTAFHNGLAQQLGSPVRLVQFDVTWEDPTSAQALLDMHQYLHEQNLGFGMIYDGNGSSTSDTGWINSAVANMEMVEGTLHIIPDLVTFDTWDAYPAYNMPETSPTTQTWWINRYPRPRTTLEAQFVGQGVQGKLTTMDGKPIANATINGYKPGVDFSQPLPVIVYQGVVPSNATFALLGVRLNMECSGCNGANDVLLGTMQYQETQGGTSQFSYSILNAPGVTGSAVVGSEIVGGTPVARIITLPGQQVLYNSQFYPVTAGAQFTFTVPAGTVGGVGWVGNVDWLWGAANGTGDRVIITPPPGKALVSTAVTAVDGTFALSPLPRTVDGPNPVSVEFDGGGGTYRSTVWTPLQ